MNQEDARISRATRFAKIWWKSRADAGKSQEFMALGLGVSKKTIQNWEKGTSSPGLFQGCEWFRIMGINPLPYYLAFLYPGLFDQPQPPEDERQVEEALVLLVRQSTSLEKRQLLYLMAGRHGSSWHSLLQMFTAHCQTSMQSRVTTARNILEDYEMEERTGHLVDTDRVHPDLGILRLAISQGKYAVQNNQSGYTTALPYQEGKADP